MGYWGMVFTFTRDGPKSPYGKVCVVGTKCSAAMDVSNQFQDGVVNTTYEDQCKAIQTMLDSRDAKCMFTNCIGGSVACLANNTFCILGGKLGPLFGTCTSFTVNYQANKDEIHKFLHFLMDVQSNEYSDSSDSD